MKWPGVLALAVLAALGASLAAAQTSPTGADLEIERKQRRVVVLPKPSPDEVRADAERAVDDYAGRSPGAVIRETSPVRPPARPDLSPDVSGGIQTDRLNRELLRR